MANHHSDEFWKAVLMYSYGYKQKEIAEAIGGSVSQPAVSRYIREARDEGLLKWRVHWPNEVDENRRTEIEESVLPREDRERLKSKLDVWTPRDRPRVQRLHVVYTEEGNISRSFGRNASPYISGLIGSVQVCMVAWGRTIRSIVDAIDPDMKARPESRILPICGEPLNHTDNAISPSVAAAALATTFRSDHKYSLRGVPARIPKDVDSDALRTFVQQCLDYRAIFTSEDPLVKRADMVLMSVGNSESSEKDPLYQDTIGSEQLDDRQFRVITAGNLGGVWLPADRNNPEHISAVDAVNDSWLGMTREQVESCCNRAAHSGASPEPGVVVVAAEAEKANIVRQSLGLVNTLVISRDIANSLLNME